jgi:hypothetical protein
MYTPNLLVFRFLFCFDAYSAKIPDSQSYIVANGTEASIARFTKIG